MIRALLLVMLGAASFAAVYLFAAPNKPASEPKVAELAANTAATDIETSSINADADAPADAELSDVAPPVLLELRPGVGQPAAADPPRAVRNVTPDSMTVAPRLAGAVAQAHPAPASPKAKTERLFNPIVVSAGTIKVREREIHLAGITAPEFGTMCGEGATQWPCGRMARAALQRFIHSRAIECEIPAGADKVPDPAECQVGGDDLAKWLVAQGWAKPSGDKFADDGKKAEDAKIGLWSPGRPKDQSADVAASD